MAIVKQYVSEKGATIIFTDDAYRDKTPEEMKKAIKNMNDVISECMWSTAQIRAERAERERMA